MLEPEIECPETPQLIRAKPKAACPCGQPSEGMAAVGTTKDALRCERCGLMVSLKIPDRAQLLSFYRDQYWTQFAEEQMGPARQNLYGHALDWIERFRRPAEVRGSRDVKGTLLDVGCGLGAFMSMSRERGWHPLGVEPSPSAVARARVQGLDAVEGVWPPSPFPAGTADVVTFVNVLDHLPDPLGALEEARRALKPGGLLYVRVPNAPVHATLGRLLSVLGWSQLTVMHLYGFGVAAFRYHLPRLGFSPLSIRTAPPSQGDAYESPNASRFGARHLFKVMYRNIYRLLSSVGLARWGWGLSIEVIAERRTG